jgi:hypothetical protein
MTNDEKRKLYAALSAPFPEAAIERTDGRITGKGYSTTGIKAQFVINRLNEVLGVGGWRTHREITVKEIVTSSGRKAYEAICDLVLEIGEWVDGKFVCVAEALADGGHTSTSEADSKKGSYSNALKKGAAMFGCGRQAYEGTLDDDNVPADPVTSSGPVQAQPSPAQAAQRSAEPTRNRVSSKQIGAVWAISRKAGVEQGSLRAQVLKQYGVKLEFLSRQQASDLIDALSRKLSSNGHGDGGAEAANGA